MIDYSKESSLLRSKSINNENKNIQNNEIFEKAKNNFINNIFTYFYIFSYEYLYSLLLMDNTGTNPIENFTGGCLGYFSAFSGVGRGIEFRTEYVEEE